MMNTAKSCTALGISTLLLMAVLWLMAPAAYAHEGSHDDDCGGPQVVIEGGLPSPFTLPSQAEQKIEIDPDAVLTIRGIDLPADASFHIGVQGFGAELAGENYVLTSGTVTVNVADFSSQARGIYQVEAVLLSGPVELCKIAFEVSIEGFGGTAAYAATGVSAVAGAGALASAPVAANGLSAKLDAKVQVARRRPQGLRRWIPVPAWKRSLFSTLVGAATGLGLAVLMQQSGISPMSLANAVWGLVLGGGVSFGAGYSLGVLKTFLKPPQGD